MCIQALGSRTCGLHYFRVRILGFFACLRFKELGLWCAWYSQRPKLACRLAGRLASRYGRYGRYGRSGWSGCLPVWLGWSGWSGWLWLAYIDEVAPIQDGDNDVGKEPAEHVHIRMGAVLRCEHTVAAEQWACAANDHRHRGRPEQGSSRVCHPGSGSLERGQEWEPRLHVVPRDLSRASARKVVPQPQRLPPKLAWGEYS